MQENNPTIEQTTSQDGKAIKGQPSGVSYPIENINNIIQVANQLVSEHGTGIPITKEQIATAVNKSFTGLSQYFSTFVQYGVFSVAHGKGYMPTELYRKYKNPVHEGDEKKYMLEMFKKPSLYAKIIENLNGHMLPPDARRFGNMLKDEPYNVTDYASEKAARVFLDNVRHLGLMDANNTLRMTGNYAKTQTSKNDQGDTRQQDPPPPGDTDLFELPIPLSGNRKAKLSYPLKNLTKKDIRVIAKALAYIASTVLEEEDAEEMEKEINRDVLNK